MSVHTLTDCRHVSQLCPTGPRRVLECSLDSLPSQVRHYDEPVVGLKSCQLLYSASIGSDVCFNRGSEATSHC